MGPKGKCPWITDDDGKAVADSQFIIEYLTEKHNIKMLELSPQDAAIARAMRAVLEDHLVLSSMQNIFDITYIQTSSYDNYDVMAKMLHGQL